nr:villin-1 isoform X1 [Ipomoea batatas]
MVGSRSFCNMVGLFQPDDVKVKEIFNFSQDDLTTEDVLVLNCHREIYVWIGRNSSINSKREAIDFVPKVLGKETPIGKLSPDIPIYIINEGCEPPFFTQCFEWDSSKANMLGNSFERKLAILKGKHQKLEAPVRSSWKPFSMETTPTNSRSSSVSANGHRISLSPASSISGSTVKSSESTRRIPSPASVTRMLFPGSEHHNGNGLSVPTGKATTGIPKSSQIKADANLPKYPYEQLTVVSKNPATDIDITRREAHLSDEEFQEKFGMARSSFYGLPRWKQNKLKMILHLF